MEQYGSGIQFTGHFIMNCLLVAAFCLIASAVAERDAHIVGGQNVSPPGKWPWQASLQRYGNHGCGASLISTEWVVTAAHCVGSSASSYTIVLGLHDRVSKRYGDPKTYKVSRITRHPGYVHGRNGFPNDVAVMKLSTRAATSSKYISTVPMASSGMDFVGSNCYITGWGQMSGSNSRLPDILQEANVDVYSKSTCRQTWGSVINDYHICVGKRNKSGACMGDSGGPLVCQRSGQWVLAGATSWGDRSCTVTKPSVYARISYFRNWIKQTTGV